MSYRLTRRAAEDVRKIYRHGVETFGEMQAEAYHTHLEHVFALIAETPRMAREHMEITPPVRVHPTGPHLVIYSIKPSGDVLIIAVPNAREDWQDTLG